MNANDFARQVIKDVKYVGQKRRPFTLPTPTLEDVIDLLHDLRERVWDYRFWLAPDSKSRPSDYMLAARDQLAELERDLEEIRIEHGIPSPEWNVMIGETPLGDERRDEIRAIRDRIHHWQPQHFGTASGNIPVYTLTGDDGRYLWLTFEDGQWWQHDGYPYSIFDT